MHPVLSRRGFEVRTLALAPGTDGGLDATVPVLSPSPRSVAAILQLGREQRWADAVVCFGASAARAHDRSPGRSRVLSVVVCDSQPTGRRQRRVLERADVVLHDRCAPPTADSREIFLAGGGESDSAIDADALAATWIDLLERRGPS